MTAEQFKIILKRTGITQTRLARLCELNPSTISSYATGKTPVHGAVKQYLLLRMAVLDVAGELVSLDKAQ